MSASSFGAASSLVSVFFLLCLVALLVVGMLRLNGSAKVLVGAGVGAVILGRILSPVQALLSSTFAASSRDLYFVLALIWSSLTQLITFIGVGMLVFAAIRAATPSGNRSPVPPMGNRGQLPDSERPAGLWGTSNQNT